MDTYPYHAMSRPYALGTPAWTLVDDGQATMQLGQGTLRTRDIMGQSLYTVLLRHDALTETEALLLQAFYTDHRADTFWWSDPLVGPFSTAAYTTYEVRFQPGASFRLLPRSDAVRRYSAEVVLEPVIPTVPTSMIVAHWGMNDASYTSRIVHPEPTTGWAVTNFGDSACTRTFETLGGVPEMVLTDIVVDAGYPRITDTAWGSPAATGRIRISFQAYATDNGAGLMFRIREGGKTKETETFVLTTSYATYSAELDSEYALTDAYFVPTTATTYHIRNIELIDENVIASADGTVVDSTGNHDGTASHNTDTMSVAGKLGTALEFITESERYVSIADHADLRLTNGGTICVWMKAASLGGNNVGRIVDKSTSTTVANGYALAVSATTKIYFNINAKGSIASENGAFVLGQWTHVAVVFDGTHAKFYSNGALVSQADYPYFPPDVAGGVRIGNRAGATDRGFDGPLDDVRIYKRPLTGNEILAIYNGGTGTTAEVIP